MATSGDLHPRLGCVPLLRGATRKLSMTAAGALGAVLALAIFACGTAHAASVTDSGKITDEIALAQAYWHAESPRLVAHCPVRVLEHPMSGALGNDDGTVPAANVWAETVDGSCSIVISPAMWDAVNDGDATDTYDTCVALAHEYGHVLGLPDEVSPAIMNSNWTTATRNDPLCGQYAYGWSGISKTSRAWLTAHGLAERVGSSARRCRGSRGVSVQVARAPVDHPDAPTDRTESHAWISPPRARQQAPGTRRPRPRRRS
jgi:hypothetical protein